MKTRAFILSLVLLAATAPAAELFLQTSTNSVVTRPPNFWPANAGAIASALTGIGFSGSGGASGLLVSNLVWVSIEAGDDGTGLPHNPSLPYATSYAAQSNAVSGDTIVFARGVYDATNLGKAGVSWWLESGAALQATDAPIFNTTNALIIGGMGDLYGTVAVSGTNDVQITCESLLGLAFTDFQGTARVAAHSVTGTNLVTGAVEFYGSRFTAAGNWLQPGNLTVPTVWFLKDCRATTAPATNSMTVRGSIMIE